MNEGLEWFTSCMCMNRAKENEGIKKGVTLEINELPFCRLRNECGFREEKDVPSHTSTNQCLHRKTGAVCFCTTGWWDKWAFDWWWTSERHVPTQSAHGQNAPIAAWWLSSALMKLFSNVKLQPTQFTFTWPVFRLLFGWKKTHLTIQAQTLPTFKDRPLWYHLVLVTILKYSFKFGTYIQTEAQSVSDFIVFKNRVKILFYKACTHLSYT